ncbi:hypothetical protein PIB30_016142 [Stylosanthes scabra]|uniref:Uncharacterized protein n=1 Tax=Stylosanthes scabra TaxID=79078 RepID=A0ABU6S6P0_9FABA|nr:hypothetical protein [Stylosanthes scabra]
MQAQRPEQLPRTYGDLENPSFRKLIRHELRSIDVGSSTDPIFELKKINNELEEKQLKKK